MAGHDYSAQQALEVLLRKLSEKDEELEDQVRAAIDVGKDVLEREARVGKRKQHTYRKAVRFTDEEALETAVAVLQAYFVEQPLFMNSAIKNFFASPLADPTGRELPKRTSRNQQPLFTPTGANSDKRLEVELRTETQISSEGPATFALRARSPAELEKQAAQIDKLRQLFNMEKG